VELREEGVTVEVEVEVEGEGARWRRNA